MMAKKQEATPKSKQIPGISVKKCNSCIICVESCPVDCLSMTVVPEGIPNHKYPYLLNPDMCISCGTCAEECPVDAIDMIAAPGKAAA